MRSRRGLTATLLLIVACGGGGGGSPTAPPPPEPEPATIEFSPSGGAGVDSIRLVEAAGTTRDVLVLSLEATAVEDLYGLAFDLGYPSRLLRFESVSEGSFLGAEGSVDTSLQLAEPEAGNLVVGHTRLGQVAGRTGSGTVLTFEFSRVSGGEDALEFSDAHGFDSTGEEIASLVWSAGTVSVPL